MKTNKIEFNIPTMLPNSNDILLSENFINWVDNLINFWVKILNVIYSNGVQEIINNKEKL
ncbi:MAG: hypothetical protein MJ201_01015 [Mycoplasmoidaceae bacterium]|nr:hypothetical protein [Mycoplasmoidaceae bacterium]